MLNIIILSIFLFIFHTLENVFNFKLCIFVQHNNMLCGRYVSEVLIGVSQIHNVVLP